VTLRIGCRMQVGYEKLRFSTNITLYLKNDTRYDQSYYGIGIGNRTQTFEVGLSFSMTLIEWLIVLRQPRTSPADSDYALPVVTNFLCRVTNSAHLVVGPLLSLNQRVGIRGRLTSAIRRVVTSLSDVHWKHSCSLSTSVSSALEVFLRRCAI